MNAHGVALREQKCRGKSFVRFKKMKQSYLVLGEQSSIVSRRWGDL